MKYIATYCLLLAWCGYFMFGQLAPIWATNSVANTLTCHLEKQTQEKKDGCCAKMHKGEKEPKGQKQQNDKGDCCQSDCSLSCCHLSAVILSNLENTIPVHLVAKTLFCGLAHNLLPNPFLGVVSPPPNCG